MKIFKTTLLATAIALAGVANSAMARDNLDNCYGAIASHVDTTAFQRPDRELFVLIDQTMKPDAELKRELIRKTLGYLHQGDRITVVSFSAYAKKHYTELVFSGAFEHSLPEASFKSVPIRQTKAFKRCLKTQWSKGRTLIANRIIEAITSEGDAYDFSHTELVGTLNTLAKDLIGKSDAKERSLLLLSDMFENSHMTTFFRKGEVRLIKPTAEMAKIKKAGMIPDLSGIKVYIIGGGWLEDGSLYQDARRLKAMRRFWERFFAASGGKLEGFGEPMLLTDIR
ncbi:MAG: hypothetical protein DIZ77_10185 [endosymbiont of Seepiophila jonesi]|uniref:VWFA domain-containing protein n=1 Tax=endosymbiont of Lamellibrachia luymesi TaxID=2200907 RepID=A0A370DYW2_9GAMM|nr:MAG: hypothetical protein DIZ79_07465 [endosymbiont of Lamellibrachia luymesi]RDH91765.1 MAG: hypothetical protein DIZ77_10185 [endosymbiont of Seepiophila jonesi]